MGTFLKDAAENAGVLSRELNGAADAFERIARTAKEAARESGQGDASVKSRMPMIFDNTGFQRPTPGGRPGGESSGGGGGAGRSGFKRPAMPLLYTWDENGPVTVLLGGSGLKFAGHLSEAEVKQRMSEMRRDLGFGATPAAMGSGRGGGGSGGSRVVGPRAQPPIDVGPQLEGAVEGGTKGVVEEIRGLRSDLRSLLSGTNAGLEIRRAGL